MLLAYNEQLNYNNDKLKKAELQFNEIALNNKYKE